MVALICTVVALILFVVAGANETLFDQPPADLIAWGLAFYVLGILLQGAWGFYQTRNPG